MNKFGLTNERAKKRVKSLEATVPDDSSSWFPRFSGVLPLVVKVFDFFFFLFSFYMINNRFFKGLSSPVTEQVARELLDVILASPIHPILHGKEHYSALSVAAYAPYFVKYVLFSVFVPDSWRKCCDCFFEYFFLSTFLKNKLTPER